MSLTLIYRTISTRSRTTFSCRWPGVSWIAMSFASSRCGSGRPSRSAMQTEPGACRAARAIRAVPRKAVSHPLCSPTST
jgi:hypothetical protein